MRVIFQWPPCLYLNPPAFLPFFLPCPVEEAEWESSWVGIWQPAKVNLPHWEKTKRALSFSCCDRICCILAYPSSSVQTKSQKLSLWNKLSFITLIFQHTLCSSIKKIQWKLSGDSISTSKVLKSKKMQVSLCFYMMSVIVLLKYGHKYETHSTDASASLSCTHSLQSKKVFVHKKICPT